jgi:hypothetical protein
MYRSIKQSACVLLLVAGGHAAAETCLNIDKDKYASNDVRSFDYGKCKLVRGAPDNSYNSLSAIGKQMQGIMDRREEDGGMSDAKRAAYQRSAEEFIGRQKARRSHVKYGASVELGGVDYAKWTYESRPVTDEQEQAIRQEIGDVIASGKLIETYGATDYASAETWKGGEAATRWKNCEVATQLVRAYVYGDFIEPAQKNPAKGLAIAQTGLSQRCGGTAYWLGRIYEDGDKAVKGVDNSAALDDGKDIKSAVEHAYDTAIMNGYTPAYERMAEMYRLGGPARFRGKTYFVLADMESYPYWSKIGKSDERFLTLMQFSKCVEADKASLVCARGLKAMYADEQRNVLDGYSTYNKELAAYYADYVSNLEALLSKAGLPVAAAR